MADRITAKPQLHSQGRKQFLEADVVASILRSRPRQGRAWETQGRNCQRVRRTSVSSGYVHKQTFVFIYVLCAVSRAMYPHRGAHHEFIMKTVLLTGRTLT